MWWKRKKNAAPAERRKPLVVMVDDEPDLCTIVRLALEDAGYDYASAGDGASGLELIRARRPDLAILDIKMPRLNGYQVLARMQQDPELGKIPVFIMTSVAEGEATSDEEWAARLGVRRFIAKPMEPEAIVAAVRELI